MKALILALALGLAALGIGPLHQAAHQGDIDAIKQLVSEGMDPDIRDTRGLTAMHYAVLDGKVRAIRELINAGADVDARIDPSLASKPKQRQSPGKKLPKQAQGVTAMQIAAAQGEIEALKVLIEEGADVNARNVQKLTALHMAVAENRMKAVEILLDAGADPDLTDHRGRTVLTRAAQEGSYRAVSMLVDAGADPNMGAGGRGWTLR